VGLGSFPLAAGHYRSATASSALQFNGIRSLVGVGTGFASPRPSSRSTPTNHTEGSTSIDFGENQLSPGLISLSPLRTSHPNGFQPIPVRASTTCYGRFTLLMRRSPWLRVYPRTLDALVSGLAFAVAPSHNDLASRPRSNSPDHNAKGTQSAVHDPRAVPASYRL
jgi:hypothetical protein